MDLLKTAKNYVKAGYSVIPLHAGTKIPAIPWKPYTKHIASADVLKNWFSEGNFNIGIVTGKISGIAVIDYDSLDVYIEDDTPTVKTPNGYHCYYKWEDGITNASLGEKTQPIDIRGEGGFVVAPASSVDGIIYKWVKGKTPKLPLKDLPKDMIKVPKVVKNCPSEVSAGNRNNKLFSFCCDQVKLNSYKKYYEKILNWNQALETPLEVGEVEKTLDNVYDNHKKYILDQLENLMY